MLLITTLFTFILPLTIAQASGCCFNPGASIAATCNFQSFVSKDQDCCPKPETANPSFYKSASFPSYPLNAQDCETNFFLANSACDAVDSCKIGCCCEPSGPSTKTKVHCTGTGTEFFNNPCSQVSCQTPQCNDGIDNDNNGCTDSSDTGCVSPSDTREENGICIGSSQGCSDPTYVPALSAFSVIPLKGKKQFLLSWQDECSQNSLSYDIFRCLGDGCTTFTRIGSSSTQTFTDSSDSLLFDTHYSYLVRAHYSIRSATPQVQKTASLGNIECLGKSTFEKFCVQPSTYLASKDYLIINFPLNFSTANFISEVRGKFSSKINKGFSCDSANVLQYAGVSCSPEEACIVKGSVPTCVPTDKCQQEGFNAFQLFGFELACENGKYCFYDKSTSPIDACYACKPEMNCYDYKSQGTCGRDNCGVSNCQWKTISTELGVGACITMQEKNCVWCDKSGTEGMESNRAHNKVYGGCTKEKADQLSTPLAQCIFTGTSAKTCDAVICTDIIAANCPSTPVQFSTNNKLVPRGIQCGADMCRKFSNKCRKDADADGNADCSIASCEADIFPPDTSFVAIISNGSLNQIRMDIRDKAGPNGALALRTTPDYETFLCKNACPINHPFGISTTSQTLLYSNRKLFDKNTLKNIMNLTPGENTLKYYSRDPSKNVGEIKSITFTAPSTSTGPIVGNLSIPGATEHFDALFAGRVSTAEIIFLEPAIITFAQLKNPATGDRFQPSFSASEQTITRLTFTSPIPDGEYTLEINAKNQEGVFMSPLFSKTIVVDSKPPRILNSTPANGSLLRFSSASFSLGFAREAILTSVWIDGKDFSKNFTTLNNKVYSASVNISDGNKFMLITATSFAGITTTIPLYFVMNARPLEITLISPPYGVSAQRSFDVIVGTDNDAQCRHSIGSKADFQFMEPFLPSGGTEHKLAAFSGAFPSQVTLFVTCNDILQGQKTSSFTLSFDNTSPFIITSFAFPNPIQDEDNSTSLTVQTDDESICKYSRTNPLFAQMIPFDSFVSSNFSTISRQRVTEGGDGKYTYFVACQNKAQLISPSQNIFFTVNHTLPALITSLTPSIISKTATQLLVKTSKTMQCRFSQTDRTAVSGSLFGPPALVHSTTLALDDGHYTFFVACRDQSLTTFSPAIVVNFTVDTQPPSMLFVDDSSTFESLPQQSCLTDRLRVKWLAEDRGSGVREYFYSLLQGSTEIVGFTRALVSNEFLFVKNLSLQDNTKYVFKVKAKDFVDLESQPLLSDGVIVDTSLCLQSAKCGDGNINTAGEECDGTTFGTIKGCTQYSNFASGTLKCSPQCRIDTSGCNPESRCGNGILDPGEACDRTTFGKITSCSSYNGSFSSGTIGCTPSCELDTTSCTEKAACGNGIIDAGESCDKNSFGPLDGSCTSYSPLRFTSGTLKCTNCHVDTSGCQDTSAGLCGDGSLNKDEECDGTAFGTIASCTAYPSFTGGTISCSQGCALNTSGCIEVSSCGNGIIDAGESCEGATLGPIPLQCADYTPSFKTGKISCSSCKLNTKECRTSQDDPCGNGKLDIGELCDGNTIGNISDISCRGYSPYFLNGTLNCRVCRLTTDGCLSNESLNLRCNDRGDCATGANCTASADCGSGFCNLGKCAAATCSDSITNQEESAVDCGGTCKACGEGERCRENKDCGEQSCSFGFCKPMEECADGKLSPGEVGVDCGGTCEKRCGQGDGCISSGDCVAGLECRQGTCKICSTDDTNCDGVTDTESGTSADSFIQWAIEHGFDVNNPNLGEEDPDSDGLTNRKEFSFSTDPLNPDTDGDGATDGDEIDAGTNPLDPNDYPPSSVKGILIGLLVLGILGAGGYYAYARYYLNNSKQSSTDFSTFGQQPLPPLPEERTEQAPIARQSAELTEQKKEMIKEKSQEKHDKERNERENIFSIFSHKTEQPEHLEKMSSDMPGKQSQEAQKPESKTPQKRKIIIRIRKPQQKILQKKDAFEMLKSLKHQRSAQNLPKEKGAAQSKPGKMKNNPKDPITKITQPGKKS